MAKLGLALTISFHVQGLTFWEALQLEGISWCKTLSNYLHQISHRLEPLSLWALLYTRASNH